MYEAEAGNVFFMCERRQPVATATDVVTLHRLTRWERLRAPGTKEEEQRERARLPHPAKREDGRGKRRPWGCAVTAARVSLTWVGRNPQRPRAPLGPPAEELMESTGPAVPVPSQQWVSGEGPEVGAQSWVCL